MAFSRTNPDVRRRDDRTMTAQAMRVVADSLKGEIQAEFDRLIDYSPAVKTSYRRSGPPAGQNITIHPDRV